MKTTTLLFFFLLWAPMVLVAQNPEHNLSVRVIDKDSRLPIEFAQVSIVPCQCGGVTNEEGEFEITLRQGTYQVSIDHIGYGPYSNQVSLKNNFHIDIELLEHQERLSEVIVRAKKVNDNIESPQMGTVQLTAQTLKKLPSALGEFDVLRGITLLAGVNNAGDLSNGLSVRGGTLDQNLLLYEDALIFNPTHFFGLISVFTPDVLSSVDLYKANIPSRFGGRVASVLDVKVRDPYADKFKMRGGIGVLSSRLSIETPLIKDKLMLEAGVRSGFTDFLLPLFSERLKKTKARYTDGTFKLLYLPTEKDQISLTGFYSKDFYELDLVTRIENISSESNQYDFGTLNGTLKWVHSFNENTALRTTFVNSDYVAKIIFPEIESDNEIEFRSDIKYVSLNSELVNALNEKVDYYAGIQADRYQIDPGKLDPGTAESVHPITLDSESAYEISGYGNLNWNPTDNLSIATGLRYNHYILTGPYTLSSFNETDGTLESSEFFDKGKTVQTYDGIEPRLGLSYQFNENTSIKGSYARVNQYLQNIYNSTTPLPTSRWKVSDPNIRPQVGNTYGLGLYRNFSQGAYETSIEGYYRESKNVLTYKPGADFFLERFVEQDVVQGLGKAYGVELSVKKTEGKINGWFNYTWSRSRQRSNNEILADRINNNQWYASDFDRTHVFNATVNFESHKYNTFSFNFTGQTGRPYTAANGVVTIDEIDVPIFLERNNTRLPVYHRLDFSWNIHFSKSKKNKRWENDWTFTMYNLYGRRNPINVYYTQRQDFKANYEFFGTSPLGAFQLSILNSPLISLTYNFKFQ
ncbi:MAG: TonB-dependent receptor [Allomuricauda sp.]